MTVNNSLWLPEEEEYLHKLSRVCQILSIKYRNYHTIYKKKEMQFKVPAIVISAVTGLVSFGSSNYPENSRVYIAIAVGVSSVSMAILNSIESYMKIGEIMAGCIQASINLQKLKEHIDIELLLPPDDRVTQGIMFLRDVYSRYEKIIELSPSVFKTLQFVYPYDINMKLTEVTKTLTSEDLELGKRKNKDDDDNIIKKDLKKLKTVVLA